MEFKVGNIFITDLQFGSSTEVKDKALFDELNSTNVFDAFRELEFYDED